MHMLSMFCSNVFQRLLWESAPLDVWSTPRRPGGAVGPREAGRAGASARLHWLEDRGAARSGGAGKAPRVDALQTLQSLAGVWIVAPKFRRPDETVSLPHRLQGPKAVVLRTSHTITGTSRKIRASVATRRGCASEARFSKLTDAALNFAQAVCAIVNQPVTLAPL